MCLRAAFRSRTERRRGPGAGGSGGISRSRRLPAGHAWLTAAGKVYYAYNGDFYVWDDEGAGYLAVEKPSGIDQRVAVVAVPIEGQGPRRLSRDRYRCHTWAVAHSDFDPITGNVGKVFDRGRYDASLSECLAQHGYDVR